MAIEDFVKEADLGTFLLRHMHDGELEGVVVQQADVKLYLKPLDQEAVTLVLPNLIALKADDFRQGNIVFEGIIYQGQASPREVLAYAYDYELPEEEVHLQAAMERVRSEKLYSIELTSSYGCELCAVFKEFPRIE